jgi:hypothetical protein
VRSCPKQGVIVESLHGKVSSWSHIQEKQWPGESCLFHEYKVVHFAVSYSHRASNKELAIGRVAQQRVLSKKIRERGREILSMGLCESVHDEASMQSLVQRSCFVSCLKLRAIAVDTLLKVATRRCVNAAGSSNIMGVFPIPIK